MDGVHTIQLGFPATDLTPILGQDVHHYVRTSTSTNVQSRNVRIVVQRIAFNIQDDVGTSFAIGRNFPHMVLLKFNNTWSRLNTVSRMSTMSGAQWTPVPVTDGSSVPDCVFKTLVTQRSGYWRESTVNGALIGFGYFDNHMEFDLGVINNFNEHVTVDMAIITMRGEYMLRLPAVEVVLRIEEM